MRKPILLLALAACVGCDAGNPSYTVLHGLLERSASARCQPKGLDGVALDNLAPLSDTSFIVLDAAQQRVIEYDYELRPMRSFAYVEHGPAAVDRPQDLAALSDTAVAIAARGGLKLVILGWDGELLETVPLEFAPNAIATSAAGDVLITAMPLGGHPQDLLHRYRDGVVDVFPVPVRPYPDMTVGALGNSLLPLSLGEGEALAIGQVFAPRAFAVNLHTGDVISLPAPTVAETADRIEYIPDPPVTGEDINRSLVPALDASADPTRGTVYVMTKSGRVVQGVDQRILMRLDEGLGYQTSWTLDVSVGKFAVFPELGTVVVADNSDNVYLCTLPDPSESS